MRSRKQRRRDMHDIVIEIMKTAKKPDIRKTHIMYKVALSFDQVKIYLKALTESGFLIERNGFFHTTGKGLNVIEACNLCLRLMEETR